MSSNNPFKTKQRLEKPKYHENKRQNRNRNKNEENNFKKEEEEKQHNFVNNETEFPSLVSNNTQLTNKVQISWSKIIKNNTEENIKNKNINIKRDFSLDNYKNYRQKEVIVEEVQSEEEEDLDYLYEEDNNF